MYSKIKLMAWQFDVLAYEREHVALSVEEPPQRNPRRGHRVRIVEAARPSPVSIDAERVRSSFVARLVLRFARQRPRLVRDAPISSALKSTAQ